MTVVDNPDLMTAFLQLTLEFQLLKRVDHVAVLCGAGMVLGVFLVKTIDDVFHRVHGE